MTIAVGGKSLRKSFLTVSNLLKLNFELCRCEKENDATAAVDDVDCVNASLPAGPSPHAELAGDGVEVPGVVSLQGRDNLENEGVWC